MLKVFFLLFFFPILHPSSAQFSLEEIKMLNIRLQSVKLTTEQYNLFQLQLSSGIALKEDIERLITDDITSQDEKIIFIKKQLLKRMYDKLLEMTNPMITQYEYSRKVTDAAIQRAKKRKLELQRQQEEEKKAHEEITYVSNLRKLELVDGTIQTLRNRANHLELSDLRELM